MTLAAGGVQKTWDYKGLIRSDQLKVDKERVKY
jgi:hypothetical protein